MKYLRQFLIIALVSFVGEALSRFIPLPVPGGVYGIVILFLLLCLKIVPLCAVEGAADFLIEIMPVMFIPPAVGLLESWGVIGGSLLAYAVTVPVTTVLVMGVGGLVTQLIIRRGGRRGEEEAEK